MKTGMSDSYFLSIFVPNKKTTFSCLVIYLFTLEICEILYNHPLYMGLFTSLANVRNVFSPQELRNNSHLESVRHSTSSHKRFRGILNTTLQIYYLCCQLEVQQVGGIHVVSSDIPLENQVRLC